MWRQSIIIVILSLAWQAIVLASAWQAAAESGAASLAIEDSWMYRGMADMIRDHGLLYDGPEYEFEVRVRMPGYPLLILAADWVGDIIGVSSGWVLTIAQVGLMCATCVLLGRIAAALTTERVGFCAGILAALTPGNNIYSVVHMPEVSSTALWLAALYLGVRGVRTESAARLVASGVCMALASWLKPVFFYCWLPAVLTVLLLAWPRLWSAGRASALFLTGFLIGIAPVYARNYMIWQELVFSLQGGSQQYLFVRPILLAEAGQVVHDPSNRLSGGYVDLRVPSTEQEWEEKFGSPWSNLAKRTMVYERLAREDLGAHLLLYLQSWAARQPRLYAGTGILALANLAEPDADRRVNTPPAGLRATWARIVEARLAWLQVLSWALLAIIYVGAIAGAVVLLRRREWTLLLSVLLFLGYFALVVTLIPHTRYRFPMMYLFAFLAGIGLSSLWPARPSAPVHTE